MGSGKTMCVLRLCEWLKDEYSMAVITNDIYTREDAEFLLRAGVLPADRVIGVETGGCPHTAIRDDTSMNMAAALELERRHPDLQLLLMESGGDNLSVSAAIGAPRCGDWHATSRLPGDIRGKSGGGGRSRPLLNFRTFINNY